MKILAIKSSFGKAALLILCSMLMVNAGVWAQEHAMDTTKTKMMHVMLVPAEMTWADAPAGLPAGAKVAVLSGDPAKEGLFSIRIKFPANYTIAAHSHPTDEHIAVLSGTFAVGMGDKFDSKQLKTLSAGGYALLPQNMNHYAMAKGETIVQLYGLGPFAITYVNPADDPRNKKQ
jgi:quercetin dioxygenase-like cupin family protein